MGKKLAVLVLVAVFSVGTIVYAYEGKGRGDRKQRHAILSQLPAEKEMLFHQTMREVREKTADIRDQVRGLKAEINDILMAPEFNEALFLEKTKRVQELHGMMRETKDQAIVKLAKQFTREERAILAKLIPPQNRFHDRKPGR
jgi:uncharacterized membrane protein